ncbi:MAG: C39 family peptidase [bacterium]
MFIDNQTNKMSLRPGFLRTAVITLLIIKFILLCYIFAPRFSSYVLAANLPNKNTVQLVLPEVYSLDVPFVTQAPTANWDRYHLETCEEAAVLMVSLFHDHVTEVSAPAIEREFKVMTDTETEMFGYYENTTLAEVQQFAEKVYGFTDSRMLENPSDEDLKREIFAGRPVIIPANGQKLKNPHFNGNGSTYHVIVITGWDAQGFITNDSGTRYGKNYRYSYETISGAMGDWDGSSGSGSKRALVLSF